MLSRAATRMGGAGGEAATRRRAPLRPLQPRAQLATLALALLAPLLANGADTGGDIAAAAMRHLLQSQDYVATPQDTGCFPGVNVGKVDYPAYSANLPNLRLSDCINECQDEDGCQFLRWSPSYEAFCHVRGPPDLRTGRTADARQQLCFPVSNQMFNGTLPHFCVWESDVTGIESARPPASNPTDCALSCASPFIDCAYFFWNPVDRTCSLRHSPYSPSSNAGTSGYSRNGQVCFQTTAFMTAALPPDASQAGQGPSPAPPPPTGDLLPGASPLPTPSTFPAPASSAFPFVGCAANVSSPYSFVVTNITSGDNIPGGDVMCGELRTSLACDARDPCCSTDLSEIRLLINDVCEGALFSVQFGETIIMGGERLDTRNGAGTTMLVLDQLSSLQLPEEPVQVCLQLKFPCSSITGPSGSGFCANNQCQFALMNAAGTCCPQYTLEDPDAITNTPPPLVPPM